VFPSWSSGNVTFAVLLLSCLFASLIGELTLPLVLLFELFVAVLCSLASFSHQVIASPSQSFGNVMVVALSLAPLLCSCIGELTLPLVLLIDLFAALWHSLASFSCQAIASPSQLSGNVMLAMLSLAPLLFFLHW